MKFVHQLATLATSSALQEKDETNDEKAASEGQPGSVVLQFGSHEIIRNYFQNTRNQSKTRPAGSGSEEGEQLLDKIDRNIFSSPRSLMFIYIHHVSFVGLLSQAKPFPCNDIVGWIH